ncbi:MAG TPA: branched-chain amino acid ABC transporter permease [Candidatus Limnocylindria bacterium]|nr:branched-chain amino acid ABC transporter permease [Candidatus Limnocylindria bacterium]
MEWVNAVLQGALLGGVYALLATGLSLVFGVMRIVNLAQGDLTILAAFVAVSVVQLTGLGPIEALALVVPLMMGLGYVLQRGLLDHSLGRGVLPPVLVTFGLAIVIQNLLLSIYTADTRGLNAGAIETDSIRLSPEIAIGVLPLLTLIVAVAILVGLQLLLSRTGLGRALRATSDDAQTATLMGIDDRRMFAIAMAIALGTVAVAGVFLGIRTSFGPVDGPARLIFAFEAVIIGGLGSLWGTLIGGIMLGVAQGIGNQLGPAYPVLAGHLLFLLVLAFRPQGLFARRQERQS